MSQYLVLSRIEIQNANSIAGLTWGFPAITQFLGFTHALNRKISRNFDGIYDFELAGCGVVSHSIHNKVYQPKEYSNFEFIQSRNPPVLEKNKNGKKVPVIEEGKMNLTVSLVIELDKPLTLTTDEIKEIEQTISALCYRMRIAGGTLLTMNKVKVLSASTESQHTEMQRKIKRLIMPGFVLLDRSDYLQQHYQDLIANHKRENLADKKPQLIDAWLDFSALKFKAIPVLAKDQNEPDENTQAKWEYIAKPQGGYLVPIMTGYKAISSPYEKTEVEGIRAKPNDNSVDKVCFVEAIHSVGEWKSIHNITKIEAIIWRYQYDEQWYLCKQNSSSALTSLTEFNANELEQTQTVNLNEASNIF